MNFIVRLGIFPYDIMVSIDQTDEELEAILKTYGHKLKKEGRLDKTTDDGRFIWYGKSNVGVIRLRETPESACLHGSLAHEIFHAVDFILRQAGIRLTDDSDETYAYAIGYLTQEIYSKLYEFKSK